jgi:acyl dehydratase
MGNVVEGVNALREMKGRKLGTSDWRTVSYEQIQAFAKATGDHQWIHTDRERCAKESPFKVPIAHGYLTLSIVPVMFGELLDVRGVKMGINYGLNKLRYPAPVPEGSRVRLAGECADVEEIPGGVQVTVKGTVEVEGSDKPALVAELLYRFYA